jgi:hypothetical protein
VDRRGAVETIAEQPFGRALLVALAVGFGAYATWRIGRAAFPLRADRERPGRRWTHLGSGLLYLAVFVGVVRFLTGTAGDSRAEADSTRALMRLPLGQVLVAAVGLGVIASGGWSVYRAATGRWRNDLRRLPARAMPWATVAAVGGLAARALAHLLIGAFLWKAAWDHDPSQAAGLDETLRRVSEHPAGVAVLAGLAVGYLARSVFAVFESRYRKGT